MVVKIVWFVAILFGVAWGQTELNLLNNITLPGDLEGKISEEQLKGLQDKAMPQLKSRCEKNGGPNAFENATKAYEEAVKCWNSLVDTDVLQKEIQDAKPNGQVDEVFKKYCAKSPQFKGCLRNMTEAMKPCFTEKEKANLKTVYNVTEQLAEFVCFKEGDRIALFIAEGGPECFQEKQELLNACVNKTLGMDSNFKFDPNEISPDMIPDLSIGEKECSQLTELQKCVVSELEKCSTPTTGNIVESLFKYIRKSTPCSDQAPNTKSNKPGSASGLAVTSSTILLAVVTALLA